MILNYSNDFPFCFCKTEKKVLFLLGRKMVSQSYRDTELNKVQPKRANSFSYITPIGVMSERNTVLVFG